MPSEASALWMRRAPTIVVVLLVLLIVTYALPGIQTAREAARRTQSKYNLKQIGMGLHNYHDAHGSFPIGGTFNADGVAHHGWTTPLEPFLASSPFYSLVEINVPWDDAQNIDLFLHHRHGRASWLNPGNSIESSPDGLPLTHYAANEWIMHRNSHVRLQDLTIGTSSTALAGDANGVFDPLGYPYNWRDITAGIGQPESGFGCAVREMTMLLMADGSIRAFTNNVDREIIASMAGPSELKPIPDRVARPNGPYRLPQINYWRLSLKDRGDKNLLTFRLSPDKRVLRVDFGHYHHLDDAKPEKWRDYFRTIINNAEVKHVELSGMLRAEELVPFLEIKSLRRLTISHAKIADDNDAVLKTARRDIEID